MDGIRKFFRELSVSGGLMASVIAIMLVLAIVAIGFFTNKIIDISKSHAATTIAFSPEEQVVRDVVKGDLILLHGDKNNPALVTNLLVVDVRPEATTAVIEARELRRGSLQVRFEIASLAGEHPTVVSKKDVLAYGVAVQEFIENNWLSHL